MNVLFNGDAIICCHDWNGASVVGNLCDVSFLVRLVPILISGLLVEGLGYMVGYAIGIGDSIKRVTKYEFHRV